MEEIQGQKEEEKKSYGKKRKSPMGIFLTILPLLLGALVVFLVYQYGKEVIRERNSHNKELIHEAIAASSGVNRTAAIFEKLNKGEEVYLLLFGDESFRSDSFIFSSLKSSLEEQYSGKLRYNEANLPNTATALSGYLSLKTMETGAQPDLIFLSFGDHDEPYTFPYYYELLLRSLMEKYPETPILPIVSYKALLSEGYGKDNAMVMNNMNEHYGLDTLNLAAVLAKQEENPVVILENEADLRSVEEKYFVSAVLSAMETAKKGEISSPINPILEESRECIAIPKSLWKDYGETALVLSEEELDKLSLKGRHGLLAFSTVLSGGENKGNLYVDGIVEGNYILAGDSYLGILTKDVLLRQQLILNFETIEEKNDFQSLFFLSPIPLEKGLKNGPILPLTAPDTESTE